MWISPCGKMYLRLRIYAVCNVFPHVQIHNSMWFYPMWKSVSPLADLHKVQWITACGDTLFNVNSLMRKSVLPHADTRENVNFPKRGNSLKFNIPHMRIYTYNCELPLVEMHPKMCIFAVRIYTNFGELPHAEIHRLMWIPTWGKVYFCGRGFAQF